MSTLSHKETLRSGNEIPAQRGDEPFECEMKFVRNSRECEFQWRETAKHNRQRGDGRARVTHMENFFSPTIFFLCISSTLCVDSFL